MIFLYKKKLTIEVLRYIFISGVSFVLCSILYYLLQIKIKIFDINSINLFNIIDVRSSIISVNINTTICFLVGASFNYIFHEIWTFGYSNQKRKLNQIRYMKYLITCIIGYGLSILIINLFLFCLELDREDNSVFIQMMPVLISTCVSGLWNFTISKLFIFK